MSYRYCGRHFRAEEIAQIRRLIAEAPGRTRAELSRLTCQVLGWYKADGGWKDMSARVAMLRMHRDGLIELPPPRHPQPRATVAITSQTDPGLPIVSPARALTPLRLQPVQNRQDSRRWNEYLHRYHYLGYQPLPGAQLRYRIFSGPQLIARLGFGAAAWQVAPRDRDIGWRPEQRTRHLPLIVNNARFLILPWVHSRNLASMILAKAARLLPRQWQQQLWLSPRPARDFRGETPLSGHLLPSGQLGLPGSNSRPGETRTGSKTECSHQGLMGLSFGSTLQAGANPLIVPRMGWPNIYGEGALNI